MYPRDDISIRRQAKIIRVSCIVAPALFYAIFFYGAPDSFPDLWIKAMVVLTTVSFAFSIALKNRYVYGGTFFMLGLTMASLAEWAGIGWLRMAFIPYVFIGAMVFGAPGALVFALCVPLFEARGMMRGITADESAVIAFSAVAGIIGFVSVLRGDAIKSGRSRERNSRLRGDASGRGNPVHDMAPPVNTDGLMREEDEALRDLLRITVFATGASGVSLYVRNEDSLRLRCSSMPQGPGDNIISPVPRWFVSDVQRHRHTIVTGNLGAETTEGFVNLAAPVGDDMLPPEDAEGYGPSRGGEAVSVAAAPVFVGSMVIGVLAVNSSSSNAFRGNAVAVIELLAAQVARTLSGGRVVAETERDAENMRLVYEEGARLVSSINLKEIVSIMSDVMVKISGMDAHVYVNTPSGFALLYGSGPFAGKHGRVDMDGTLAAMALEEGEPRYISSLSGYTQPLLPGQEEDMFTAALLLPLMCEGDVMGLVALTSDHKDPLRAETINRLDMVGSHAAISLRNSLAHRETEVKAATDGLTGLNNRSSFVDILEAEHKRFLRTGMRYAIVLMDVDHFKKVNDTYGHQAGDEVLKEIAVLMRENFRETDCLGRYGGEEFAAVLLDADVRGARRLAERMRNSLEAKRVDTSAGALRITMSLGFALAEHGLEPEEVIRRADEALYQAKEGGRNRTEFWG